MIAEPALAPPQSQAAARAAAVAAARIWLLEIPGGAPRAEGLLNTALGGSAGAPPEWTVAAQTLLVSALAAQGRLDEAEELLKHVSFGAAAEALSLANMLSELTDRATGDGQRKLADLQLRTIDDLLAKRDTLAAATLEEVSHLRATALAKTGRRQEAIAELESLAERNPRDGQSQEQLASLLMAAGDTSGLEAAKVKWREIATKSRPGSPRWFRAHYGLARTQLDLGDAAPARSTVQRIESSHPDLGGPEMKTQFHKLLAECERQSAPGAQQK